MRMQEVILFLTRFRKGNKMTPAQENKLFKISALAECIIDIAKTLDKDQLELIQAATSIYTTVEQLKVDERILDDLKAKNDPETVKVVEENGDSNITKGKVHFCESDNPEGIKGWCLLDPSDLAKIKRFFE